MNLADATLAADPYTHAALAYVTSKDASLYVGRVNLYHHPDLLDRYREILSDEAMFGCVALAKVATLAHALGRIVHHGDVGDAFDELYVDLGGEG